MSITGKIGFHVYILTYLLVSPRHRRFAVDLKQHKRLNVGHFQVLISLYGSFEFRCLKTDGRI